jgi:hypothetical protein
MHPAQLAHVKTLLNVQDSHAKRINASAWSASARSRYFFSPTSSFITPQRQHKPWQAGWDKLIQKDKPMPTYMKSRGRTQYGFLVRSSAAYQPCSLLYEVAFFEDLLGLTPAKVREEAILLRAKASLPTQFHDSWTTLVEWSGSNKPGHVPADKHDDAARDLATILGSGHILLPFRLPTEEELCRDTQMTHLLEVPGISSQDVIDAVGNCF